MSYNFDELIPRENTSCIKYDARERYFGTKEVIPMWVADMDLRTPDFVTRTVQERARHEIYGYTIKDTGFYDSIAGWMQRRHQWTIEKDWITLTPGVVAGLNLCIQSFTSPGDQIIVQSPVYFPFFSCVKNNGRELVINQLVNDNGNYRMDFETLEKLVEGGARMLILCSPHNPVCRVWTKEELETLVAICLKRNVIIVSDEIHHDLVFACQQHLPTALVPGSESITVTLAAPSKTFNIAGLSTSIAIIPDEKLREKFKKTVQNLSIDDGNLFGLTALKAAYNQGDEWLDALNLYLEDNARFVDQFVKENLPQIVVTPTQGTFLLWLDCRQLGMSQTDLRNWFIRRAGVGLSNGTDFGPGGEGFMRMNIGCSRSTIRLALDKIRAAAPKVNAG